MITTEICKSYPLDFQSQHRKHNWTTLVTLNADDVKNFKATSAFSQTFREEISYLNQIK